MRINKAIICLTIFASVCLCKAQRTNDKVKVSAYYETLCPDSIQFIREQLYPTFQELGSIMDIELIPFGKASFENRDDGSISFRCHHGHRECTGNKIQACATKILDNINYTLPFVNCMESQRKPDRAGLKCANENNINYSPIDNCARSNQGTRYLMEMGQKTKALRPTMYFVPWININDVHAEETQSLALTNLKSVVCNAYQGQSVPSACSNTGANDAGTSDVMDGGADSILDSPGRLSL